MDKMMVVSSFCPYLLTLGCRCPDGLVLHKDKCIQPSKCPCKDAGQEYEEGSVLKRDCNKCTCKGGSWDCTKNKCDAICQGNGDPHYRTFDGKNYDFMGDCKYYLVNTIVDIYCLFTVLLVKEKITNNSKRENYKRKSVE